MGTEQTITRRRFAAGMAAAGAAAVAARITVGRQPSRNRIRTAILGCRNRGGQVAATFQKSGLFEVVTLCDCDSACFAPACSD